MTVNKTEFFLKQLENFRRTQTPEHVKEKLKLLLLDYIGVAIGGAGMQKDAIARMLAGTFPCPEATIIGTEYKVSLEKAIFFNGLVGHALDFDDGVNRGIIHLGSPVFSALLPFLEKGDITGEEFLDAAVVGYETSYTLAVSIQPDHKRAGYHATGTCGTVGVAMALAEAWKFDDLQRENAFKIAVLSSTGVLKVLEDGSQLKPYNVAKAAVMGYTAAMMAKGGFQGPDDVLGGHHGFLEMMTGKSDLSLAPFMVDGTYSIEKAYIKPYAACRYCHPSIEAAINMAKNNEIKPDHIERVEIKTYSLAVKNHDHTEIQGAGSGKMSIPYGFAAGFITGRADMRQYEPEYLEDRDILALTRKVRVMEDEKCTELFPYKTLAEVKVICRDGAVYDEAVEHPKGEPENPMSLQEVKEKATALAATNGVSAEQMDRIAEIVLNFESRYRELVEGWKWDQFSAPCELESSGWMPT